MQPPPFRTSLSTTLHRLQRLWLVYVVVVIYLIYAVIIDSGFHQMKHVLAGSIWTLCSCTGMVKQMEEDKRRFGPAAWASAAPRLEKLRFLLAKETLQHMRAAEMCLSRRKETIKDGVRHTAVLIHLYEPV